VSLVDAADQGNFDVYSTDEAEARHLITREVMESVTNLGCIRNAKSVGFGFTGDSFVVKLATDLDLFQSSSVETTELITEDGRAFLEEMYEVLRIVEVVGTVSAT
jgi:hypothetical protein